MKVEDAINQELIMFSVTKCSCGKPLYITDDLIDLYCDSTECPGNLAPRIQEIFRDNNKSISFEEALELIQDWDITTPYKAIQIKKLQKPRTIIELVEFGHIYLVSHLAKELFSGYNTIESAIEGLTVQEIGKRMTENKEYCYEVYKQIQKHKKELLDARTLLEV